MMDNIDNIFIITAMGEKSTKTPYAGNFWHQNVTELQSIAFFPPPGGNVIPV